MCTIFHNTFCSFIFDKVLKYCKNLQKVCRLVALVDALLGFIILVILLVRRLRTVSEYAESTVYNLLVLGLQAFEIASAIVLYEGVRQEIIYMIKLWFLYCVARFVVLISTIYLNFVSSSRSKLRLWVYGFEIAFTLFHVIQCICLLALRHQVNTSSTSEERTAPSITDEIVIQQLVPQSMVASTAVCINNCANRISKGSF